jgi:hypothetical protein
MLLIMDRVERNSVAAHPYLMSLQEATGVYVLNRYKLANNNYYSGYGILAITDI